VLFHKLRRLQDIYRGHVTMVRCPGSSREIAEAVIENELAFGFIRPTLNGPQPAMAPIYVDGIGAVVAKDFYGLRSSISVAELRQLDYITDRRDAHTEFRRQFESSFSRTGNIRCSKVAPGDCKAAMQALKLGHSFTVSPISLWREENPWFSPECVCLPIAGLSFELSTCLAWSDKLIAHDDQIRDVVDTAFALFRGAKGTVSGESGVHPGLSITD
uniref:LysR family transcriptional regulator substrate-binding protein n=1 Tax=Mycobacteroides abscessus TaxID=36809 RepID=UPI0021065938